MIFTKYSTKEMCQIFNVNRETLRHYERQGLLSPHINPDNGYREYGYWDVSCMIDILKYRSVGLSLAEAKESIYNNSFPAIVDRLEEHAASFEKQIQKIQLLSDKVTRDLTYLKYAKDHIGEVIEASIEDLFFIPYTTDPNNEAFAPMQYAFNNSEFFSTTLIIDDLNHDLDCYGLLTEKVYADFLQCEYGTVIKKSPIVCQMIDVCGRTPIDETIAEDFKSILSEKYPDCDNTVYAILVSRFYDEDKRYHQIYFVFSKI